MAKKSAGLLVYKVESDERRVFLVHPGGPFFRNKDKGVWSIPKGEIDLDENPFDAARREFREETGQDIDGEFVALPECRYVNGKIILAWAVEGDVDADAVTAIRSKWNGRRIQGKSNRSPKSIAAPGSRSPKRGGKSTPAKYR